MRKLILCNRSVMTAKFYPYCEVYSSCQPTWGVMTNQMKVKEVTNFIHEKSVVYCSKELYSLPFKISQSVSSLSTMIRLRHGSKSTMWEVGVLLCGSIANLSWWVLAWCPTSGCSMDSVNWLVDLVQSVYCLL